MQSVEPVAELEDLELQSVEPVIEPEDADADPSRLPETETQGKTTIRSYELYANGSGG